MPGCPRWGSTAAKFPKAGRHRRGVLPTPPPTKEANHLILTGNMPIVLGARSISQSCVSGDSFNDEAFTVQEDKGQI